MSFTYDVFISCAARDKAWAGRLAEGHVVDQLVARLGKPRPRIFISYRRKETVDFMDAIEEVMERPHVTVIPVLVHEARMPGRAGLPDDIAPFAHLNAHTIDDARWEYDTEVLIGKIAPMVRA